MKKGFTLSEVLVTLGILSVIALLTIPAVLKNYKHRVYISQLKKTYSQLTDATQAIMNDEHSTNFYETSAAVPSDCSSDDIKHHKGACYFLTNYLKTIKVNCNVIKQSGDINELCVPAEVKNGSVVLTQYKNLVNGNAGLLNGEYCVQTINGAAICQNHNNGGFVTFNIDINGPLPPNETGRDVFFLKVENDGTIVDVGDTDAAAANCGNPESRGCLRRIMNNGWKMDY
ncbi:type II secretion system protein [bacterium]|nr:type II secretion system protein [bacterium]